MKNNNSYLIPFELCRFEVGFNRVLVFDIQRAKTFYLPKTILKILTLFYHNTGTEIYQKYKHDKETLTSLEMYYNFLLDKELCFNVLKHEKKIFKKISEDFETPTIVNTLNIEIKDFIIDKLYIQKIISIINKLKINSILISYHGNNIDEIYSFFTELNNSTIFHIEVSFYNVNDNFEIISDDLIKKSFRLNKIFFYCNEKTRVIEGDLFKTYIINKEESILKLENNLFTPVLDYHYFNYLESKSNNLYYNKKIFISNDFLVSNFHDKKTIENLFNINNNFLDLNWLNEKGISDLWSISKNKIEVCCSCEFNRICLDNRIPIQNTKNEKWIYSTECEYNPFISKWKGEDGYTNLEDAGIIVKQNNFIIDRRKINQLNKKLWED